MNRTEAFIQAARERAELRALELAAKEKRVREMLAQGLPVTTIASRLRMTRERVKTIRDGAPVKRAPSPDTLEVQAACRENAALRAQEREARHARARALLLEGLTVEVIASRLGMGRDTVRLIRREMLA